VSRDEIDFWVYSLAIMGLVTLAAILGWFPE
jgi:hypothetical protein